MALNRELPFDFLLEGVPEEFYSILSERPLLKMLAPGPEEPPVPFLSKFVIDVLDEHAEREPIVLTFPFKGSLPVECKASEPIIS